MKRILVLFLALAILSSMAVPVFAAVVDDPVISPQYTYIKTNSVNLTIDTDTGVATCTSSCYATSGYTVSIECRLQRYTGSSWTTLKTWTSSAIRYTSIAETRTVTSGYTYRVYSIFRIYNPSGVLVETGTNNKTCIYPASTS